MENQILSVSDAIELINQTLDYAYPAIEVEGEVSAFKVNQQKYVFFDLKDESGTLGCFMMAYQLRVPLEDGMKVRVTAQPRLTQRGKFSLTIREVRPVGEGSLKRAFVLLQTKLQKEGLFDADRKRILPRLPQRIGVISSTEAAGYADFIKILDQRWGGLDIVVAHVTVQGADAPRQVVKALDCLNQQKAALDVIVVIRGGGSLDDLSAFNDEPLVRAIAASRTPVLTGIGHETDTTLADLAADLQAPTPSAAAMMVVPDRQEIIKHTERQVGDAADGLLARIDAARHEADDVLQKMLERMSGRCDELQRRLRLMDMALVQLDPQKVLRRGYSLLRNESGRIISIAKPGDIVTIETKASTITAGVTYVKNHI